MLKEKINSGATAIRGAGLGMISPSPNQMQDYGTFNTDTNNFRLKLS